MSGYNIECFIKDFGERTWENYQYIKNRASQENLYEVTQLLNSLFGLVILPVERFKDIRNIEISKEIIDMISDLENKKLLRNTYVEEKDPVMFIRHIRNAAAHAGNCGIHPYSIMDEGKRIGGVIFYDSDTESEFCVDLSVEGIEKLAKLISLFYMEVEAKYGKNIEYDSEIDLLRHFLRNGQGELTVQKEIKKERIMNHEITEIGLSSKTVDCLQKSRILTVRDLCESTFDDLMKVRNLGKKSLDEILVKMSENGLKLKEKDTVSGNGENKEDDIDDYVNRLIKALKDGEDLGFRDKQVKILKFRFGIENGRRGTLEETEKKFGVSREKIRQIEALAIRKLKHPSRAKTLKDYLE